MTEMLPSLKALRAFEAAARHLNASRAAEELAVTQPAVTQQVKALEAFLGTRLLRRQGQGLTLTPTGRAFAERLHGAFAEITAATAEVLRRERGGGPLTVSMLPTLAQRWLIPRLGSFQEAHPEIEVRFSATARVVDLRREDVDLAIRFGDGAWPGCESTFLMANDVLPVLSPKLLESQHIKSVEDLARHTWLQVDAEPRDTDWRDWLAAAGVEGMEPQGRVAFESSSQALAAATAGLGVALAQRPFVIDDVAAGRLVVPLDEVLTSEQAYYMVTAQERAGGHRVSAFREWLLGEATHAHPNLSDFTTVSRSNR